MAAKAPQLRRHPPSRRMATLLATMVYLEARSIDDCLELFDLLMVTELVGNPSGRRRTRRSASIRGWPGPRPSTSPSCAGRDTRSKSPSALVCSGPLSASRRRSDRTVVRRSGSSATALASPRTGPTRRSLWVLSAVTELRDWWSPKFAFGLSLVSLAEPLFGHFGAATQTTPDRSRQSALREDPAAAVGAADAPTGPTKCRLDSRDSRNVCTVYLAAGVTDPSTGPIRLPRSRRRAQPARRRHRSGRARPVGRTRAL